MKHFTCILMLTLALGLQAHGQRLSGGTYNLEQSVISAVGGTVVGGSYSLEGTGTEPVAGVTSTGSPYSLSVGFWPTVFMATAADAEISGSVLGPNGESLRGVTVMLSGGTFTTPLIVKTNNFGIFSFRGIEVGGTYVIGVVSRRYGFERQNQVITLSEDFAGMVFRATWQN